MATKDDVERNPTRDGGMEDETALSHGRGATDALRGQQGLVMAGGGLVGSQSAVGFGSPGTMERGLMASPFHSDRVRAEIELQRSRPTTLDSDARALGQGDFSEASLDLDYEVAKKGSEVLGQEVRVARVEATPAPNQGRGPLCLLAWVEGAKGHR